MSARVPKVIKNFNLIVDNFGYAGLCEKVMPPDLKTKDEAHRGGGMDAPISLDMGMEELELKATMAEHNPFIFRQFGLQDGNAVAVTLRGAAQDDRSTTPITIVATGRYCAITSGDWKPGDKPPLDFTIKLRYYKITIGNREVVEIDVLAGIRKIDGVDQLAAMRDALGL